MDITPLIRPEQKIIQSYGDGYFRINGDVFSHPVLVTGDIVSLWEQGQNPLLLQDDTIKSLQGQIDILLLGTGKISGRPLPPSQRTHLSNLGMTVDIMDTPSACRTYNVLTAEGRRVAAALIPV